MDAMTRRSVLVVLVDALQSLDVTGPIEVFTGAGRHSGDPYGIRTASLDSAPVVVPGGPGQTAQMENDTLLGWLHAADATSTWTTSVCTRSLLLGRGLLKGVIGLQWGSGLRKKTPQGGGYVDRRNRAAERRPQGGTEAVP
jgi:transcriptional regulator GlxA family with amidase domain